MASDIAMGLRLNCGMVSPWIRIVCRRNHSLAQAGWLICE
jgi:hypothetical protein